MAANNIISRFPDGDIFIRQTVNTFGDEQFYIYDAFTKRAYTLEESDCIRTDKMVRHRISKKTFFDLLEKIQNSEITRLA
jgi:hypothetical protein